DGRQHAAFGTRGLSAKRIGRKGMCADYRVTARRQPAAGDQVDDVVGAIAQGDLFGLQAEALGQLGLQPEAAAVGIAGQLGQLAANGLQYPGVRAQRILVAGQLDDPRRLDAQLARQLVDRLAGDVGGQFLYAWYGQGEEISTHVQLHSQPAEPALEAVGLRLDDQPPRPPSCSSARLLSTAHHTYRRAFSLKPPAKAVLTARLSGTTPAPSTPRLRGRSSPARP